MYHSPSKNKIKFKKKYIYIYLCNQNIRFKWFIKPAPLQHNCQFSVHVCRLPERPRALYMHKCAVRVKSRGGRFIGPSQVRRLRRTYAGWLWLVLICSKWQKKCIWRGGHVALVSPRLPAPPRAHGRAWWQWPTWSPKMWYNLWYI